MTRLLLLAVLVAGCSAPAVPRQPIHVTGTGMEDTATFSASGDYVARTTLSCAGFIPGWTLVSEAGPQTYVAAAETHLHQLSGSYYLHVGMSSCPWAIDLTPE